MPALTDLLNVLKMQVEIYHNAKVCGQWILKEHELGATCFHIVTQGRCAINIPEHFVGTLDSGDLVIFPRELAHTMTAIDSDGSTQVHLDYKIAATLQGTGMLCGKVLFQHPAINQLLSALPAVFIIQRAQSAQWLEPLLSLILDQSYQPNVASSILLNRLCEILFIYGLEQHIAQIKTGDSPSFIALYSHPKLSKAVAAIHSNPAKSWSLAELAQCTHQSRTSFCNSFKKVSSWSAIEYLSWWRMQLAWDALLSGQPVATVAEQVGYQSESAFSRVFKKQFSVSAGKVRRAPLLYQSSGFAASNSV